MNTNSTIVKRTVDELRAKLKELESEPPDEELEPTLEEIIPLLRSDILGTKKRGYSWKIIAKKLSEIRKIGHSTLRKHVGAGKPRGRKAASGAAASMNAEKV